MVEHDDGEAELPLLVDDATGDERPITDDGVAVVKRVDGVAVKQRIDGDAAENVYMEQVRAGSAGKELLSKTVQYPAYVDTACAKSVMGGSGAMDIMAYCDKNEWPYRTVEEAEPFKFGPGERIMSKFALLLPVKWAGVTVLIRISVIAQRIPILLSKYLFKKLGAVLDLDENKCNFKRIGNQIEQLHDLPSGHTAIELLKLPKETAPKVSASTWAICAKGEEVTLEDPKLRANMKIFHVNVSTYAVDYEIPKGQEASKIEKLDRYGRPAIEPQYRCEDISSGDEEELCRVFKTLRSERRGKTRAAPFFQEIVPGWRARARLIFAPNPSAVTQHHAIPEDAVGGRQAATPSEDSVSGMEQVRGRSKGRCPQSRKRRPKDESPKRVKFDLEDEKVRSGGVGSSGARAFCGSSRRETSLGAERVDQKQERLGECQRGSSGQVSRSGHHEATPIAGSDRIEEPPSPRASNVGKSEVDDKRRSRQPSVDEGSCRGDECKRFEIHHNSEGEAEVEAEAWWSDSLDGRLGDGGVTRGRCPEELNPFSKALKWATHYVMDVTGRSKTLANRILKTSVNPLIQTESAFQKTTEGLEEWTEITCNQVSFNSAIFKGLDTPKWRRTVDLKTGDVIESREFTSEMTGTIPFSGNTRDVQTTVWYGTKDRFGQKSPKNKLRKRLVKGMQRAATVFLLEAMVMLSCSSQWAGAWTNRMYGTSGADVWEMFNTRSHITGSAYQQGWRTLEPVSSNRSDLSEYVDVTLDVREPRFTFVGAPSKVWNGSYSMLLESNSEETSVASG